SSGAVQFGSPGGTDTSTARSAAITNNSGGSALFFASTTAGNATITNNGGSANFFDTTTGNVHISNNGGTFFNNTSGAGSAVITNNNGGLTLFLNSSTAGTATITNNSGGVIQFFKNSDGGAASLINAGGIIDFTESSGPLGNGVLSVGALSGAGVFDVLSSQRIHVTGSLAFTSGALYIVNVRGSNASQINVNGTATLAGIVGVQANTRLTQATTFTILTSSGLNGTTFSGVTLDFANGFARDPVLSYVGNNVLLTLQPGLLSPLLPTNAPANQVKVAAAIDNALLAGNNLTNAFSAIFNLSGNGLLNGLTQLSGETATTAQQTTFDAMGLFMGLLTDPFMGRGGGLGGAASPTGYADEASAYAATKRTDAFAMFTKAPPQTVEPRWSVWAAGFGGSQSTSGNIALGSNNTTSNIAATAVGADYLFSPDTIAGFALAGGGTSFSVANGGTGRSDLFQAGAYVRHISGAAYVTGALAYGWQDITTNRTLMVAGLDQLRAEFNANAWSGRLEGGYRFVAPALGGLGITPYGAAQFVTFDLPQYAEQAIVGLNTFALSYGARDVTDVRTELGIRTDKSYAMADGILTLRGRLAWAHDYDPDRSIAATFQTLPAGSFVVNGASQASDSALTTAAVEMKWKNGWSAAATFEGEFSGVTTSYAGKGVVRYVW
ncbi:MAG: autotransporter domain-containing protein, partial [Bradyrhizobium sp.]